MTTPRLLVEIAASLGSFQADFGKASQIAEQHARRINNSIEGLKTSAIGFGKTLAGAIGIPLGAAGVIELFSVLKERVGEAERSVNQLNAVLRATGNSAGITASGLEEITKSIRDRTIFNAEDIRGAETALLRFRKVQGETFKEGIALVPDLSVALGVDLPAAAVALGRALTDPERGVRALKAAGLSLSDQQKDMAARMIEAGNAAGGQKIIIDELRKSIGGSSEADVHGLLGASARLSREFRELQEVGGKKLFGDNHGAVEELIGFFDRLKRKVDETKISFKDLILQPGQLLSQGFNIAKQLAGGFVDEPNIPRREVSGKIRGLPDLAQQAADSAAANARQKEIDEQGYLDQQEAIKRRASGAATIYAFELAAQKSFLDKRQSQYEFAYAHSNISTKQFFDQERLTIEANTRALLTNLGKQGDAVEAAANAPSTSRTERLGLLLQLKGIANQSDEARLKLQESLLKVDQKQADAIEKQKDEYEGLRIKLQELNGDSVGAAGSSFDLANKERIKGLNRELEAGDAIAKQRAAAALADINATRQREVEQAALNKIQTSFGTITEEIGIKQSRIDLLQQTSAITELDAINAKSKAASELIPILTGIADKYEAIAKSTNNPELLLGVDKLRLQIDQLAAQTDVLAKRFTDIFTGAIADGITSLVTGTKSAKDALRDIEKSIVSSISQIASKNIAETLFQKSGSLGGVGGFFAGLFGAKGDGGSAGANASLAALSGTAALTSGGLTAVQLAATAAAAALTGVAASAGASSIGGFASAGTASDIFSFLGFAGGGSPPLNKVSLVGERGPEMFVPRQAGTIIPNDVLKSRRAQKQGGDININITVPGNTSRATADQIAAQAGAAVARARRIT